MNPEWFAGRLKELREQAGLSQKALADKAGVALSAIGHLEQGRRLPVCDTVVALASALGVGVEEFAVAPTQEAPPRPRGRPKKAEEAPVKKDADVIKPAAKVSRKRKGKA